VAVVELGMHELAVAAQVQAVQVVAVLVAHQITELLELKIPVAVAVAALIQTILILAEMVAQELSFFDTHLVQPFQLELA
jgi:hypothetical protein